MEKFVKQAVEAPARIVDETAHIVKQIPQQKPIQVAKKYWGTLGPGLVTGASDDDPSGIATYSQIGAQYGISNLWLSLYTIPFLIVVQEMCARIAHVTGRGISGILKRHYPKPLLYTTVVLLFAANTLNIGADIAAMAAATRLIYPMFSYASLAVVFTLFSLFLQISMPYSRYARLLKVMTLVLFSYVITAFLIKMDWATVLHATLVPSLTLNKESIFIITAVLGTTVSPYLFYWQASQEIEQQREHFGRKTLAQLEGTNKKEIKAMRQDVATGMIFSNLVMFFIIAVTGTVLFSQGVTINSAADAAEALRPLAGPYAYLLFTIGIIGTGMLAVPVLAGSASYAFSEAFSLNQGLDKQLKQAYGFYGVIIIAMLVGLAINFLGIDPIKALIFSAVMNGLAAPLVLTLIVHASSREDIMGQWKNGWWSKVLGWGITLIMYLAAIATLVGFFQG